MQAVTLNSTVATASGERRKHTLKGLGYGVKEKAVRVQGTGFRAWGLASTSVNALFRDEDSPQN